MRTQRSLSLGLQGPFLGAAQSGCSYAIASDYSKSLYSLRRFSNRHVCPRMPTSSCFSYTPSGRCKLCTLNSNRPFSASARTQILLDDTEDLDDIEGADGHGHKGHNLNSLLRNRELGATKGKGGLAGKPSLARQRAAAARFNQHAGVKPVLSKEQVALKIKKINQEIKQLELKVSSLPSINDSVSEYLHLKYVGFEAELSRCATVNELLEQEYCRIRFVALPKLQSDVSRIAKSIPKFVQEFRQIEYGLRIAHLVLRSEALDESFSQIVGEFEQIAGPRISARRNIDAMLKPFYDMNDEYAKLRKVCNKVSGGLIGIRSMLRNLSTDEGFPRGSYGFFKYYHKSTGIIARDFAEYSHRFRRGYALRKRHQNPLSDAWSLHFLASNYRDVPGTVDILDTYLRACRTGKMISECHPRELFDLTKSLRDFYTPKSSKTRSPRSPELDIHWRQLDVLAPFEIAWASGVTMRHEMMYLLDSMMRTIQERNGLWARNSTEGLIHHVTGMKTLFRNFNTHRTELMQQYQEFMAVNWIRLQLEDKLHTLGVPDMNREKGVFTVRKPLSQSRGRFLQWAENMNTHLWASWVLTSAIRAPPEYWRKVERRLSADDKTCSKKLELDAFGIPIMGSAESGPTEPTETPPDSATGDLQESHAEKPQGSAKIIRKKRASLWRLVKKSFPARLIKTKVKPGLGPDNPKLVRSKLVPVGEKPRSQTAAQHKLKETSSGKSTDPNSIRKASGPKSIPLRAGAVSVRKNKKNRTVGQTSKPYSTVASIRSNAEHNEDGNDDVQSREYQNSIKQGDEANQTPILAKKLTATPHMSSQQVPSLDPAMPKFWSHRLHKGSGGKAIVVHYCKSLKNTEEVAKLFLEDEIIGFDMEWKAQASSTDGIQDNVSLIQIANKDRIALFQIALFHPARNVQDLVSPSLKRVLESPNITKVGVSIKADCTRLQKYLGIRTRSIFELSHLFKLVKYCQTSPKLINKRAVNLSEQVEHHFGLPLEKDDDVRCSDWTRSLNYRQVQYAATDPYAGLCLFHTMDAKREALDPVPPRPAFAELGLPIRLAEAVVVEKESKELKVVETTVTSEIVSENA